MGKCKFSDKWLSLKDSCGYSVSEWCKQKGDSEAFCLVCDVEIAVDKGFYALKRHSEGEKHRQNFKEKRLNGQLLLNPGTIRMYGMKDSSYIAELIWCMKMVSSNMPIQTSKDIVNVFKAMFPSVVPSNFSLNPTKAGYLITDALSPYFRELFLNEARLAYYTLQFDETTNNAGFKELHTRIRYWSESKSKVMSHHLETFFMGHAKAADVKSNLMSALDNAGLSVCKLLMLSCDGPNVNKSVFSLMKEEIKSVRITGLLEVGFCNIHVLHNAFLKGMAVFGMDASDLIISLFHFFDGWPARRHDFSAILKQKEIKDLHFIKHVNSRWLTIEPAANRVLELWDAISHYFLKFIPLKESRTMESESYKKIVALLRIQTIKAELKFVCISSAMFTSVTGFFQNEEPLLHCMFDKIKTLVQKLMGRVCKLSSVHKFMKGIICDTEIFDDANLLSLSDVPLGGDLENLLIDCTDMYKKRFRSNVQKHYVAAGKYILKKDLLTNDFLWSVTCLKPDAIKNSSSLKKIQQVAQKLPLSIEIENLIDEWKLLQLEQLENKQIEIFWSDIFKIKEADGSLKFQRIKEVVTAVLTLAHGSADVERAFSKSARTMTDERASMSVRTLNAHLTVADGMKAYRNKPEIVPITEKLLNFARVAHKSYSSYLENEKEKKEKQMAQKEKKLKESKEKEEMEKMYAQSKNSIIELETKLKTVRDEVNESTTTTDTLLEEANKRLRNALQKNDLADAKVAQAMIDGALARKEKCKDKQKDISAMDRQLHKRKDNVITNFFRKKPKL